MDVIENTLKEMGIGREQIFLERFVSPADPDTPKDGYEQTEPGCHTRGLHGEVGRRNARSSL